MIVRRLIVHGEVQGVFYRGWTIDTARRLGLDGWVRNRHDGSVEILVAGNESAVQDLIHRCQTGPPAATVDRIEVEETAEQPAPGFRQRATI